MTRIPLVTDYGNRTGYMTSDPVFEDLVYENVRHYQLDSDHDTGLHAALNDIFVTIGMDADEIEEFTVAASVGLALDKDCDAKYVGTSGVGLDAGDRKLKELKERMAALGLSVLVTSDRVQRTATEDSNERVVHESDLSAMARGTEDALEEMLGLFALWMGKPEEWGGSLEVNKDFGSASLSPQMAQVLLQAVINEKLPVETMWETWLQHGLLPDSFDPDKAKALLEEQASGELEAVAAAIKAARAAEPPADDPAVPAEPGPAPAPSGDVP